MQRGSHFLFSFSMLSSLSFTLRRTFEHHGRALQFHARARFAEETWMDFRWRLRPFQSTVEDSSWLKTSNCLWGLVDMSWNSIRQQALQSGSACFSTVHRCLEYIRIIDSRSKYLHLRVSHGPQGQNPRRIFRMTFICTMVGAIAFTLKLWQWSEVKSASLECPCFGITSRHQYASVNEIP